MINIVSTFYVSNCSSPLDNARNEELEECLLKNISSNSVEKIHLFVDDDLALTRLHKLSNNSDKIVVIEVGKQPKYGDFFNYIIHNLTDKICMITNADIFLYESNYELIEKVKENKIAYALTRYEHDMTHPLMDHYQGSHDSYIFHAKFLDKTIINEHTDFYQNFLGIESHIIKAFCDDGFKVLNPCKQIKIVHLHKTDLRNHGKWIGLHNWGDDDSHRNSCWWVPPITFDGNPSPFIHRPPTSPRHSASGIATESPEFFPVSLETTLECIRERNVRVFDETGCKYVSSRGLLKSCVSKSTMVKSSIGAVCGYNFSKLVDGDTIYICSAAIYDFVENYLPQIRTRFILLSGDSDTPIPTGIPHYDSTFNKLINNEYLIVWFSQNLVYSPTQYSKLQYLPIGLDYHTMSEQEMWWGPKSYPKTQEELLISLRNAAPPLYSRKPIAYTTCHFALYRGGCPNTYNQIPTGLIYYEPERVQREVSWRTQMEYAFVLSPPGKGLDCHRTWEALCLGCIPIIISTPLDDMFGPIPERDLSEDESVGIGDRYAEIRSAGPRRENSVPAPKGTCGSTRAQDELRSENEGLPVLIVKSLTDITKELLDDTIADYKKRKFCMEKLELKYWLNRIESYKNQ